MKRASGSLLLIQIAVLFLSSSAAAQDKNDTSDSVRPQSLNQIVGFSDQKLGEQIKIQIQASRKAEAARAIESAALPAVLPPAPNVIKLSSNSISIPADQTKSGSKFESRPVVASRATVGSNYGYRRDPFTRRARFHAGVDIKAQRGDPVGASQRGVVEFAGWYYGYGKMIIVNHGGGVRTHYAHLSAFDVQVGARVERGTIIGRAGSTGRATSPHLHYEVRVDGIALDPLQPLALDPSSDYFKQAQSQTTARVQFTDTTRPRRVN